MAGLLLMCLFNYVLVLASVSKTAIRGFLNDQCFESTIFLVDKPVDGIMGMDLISRIDLVMGTDAGLIFSIVPDIVRKFKHVFDRPLISSYLKGIDPFPIIRLTENAQPKRSAIREINNVDKDFVKSKT